MDKIAVVDKVPSEFFLIGPKSIKTIFPKPTLVHVAGESKTTIFISILLHGNETSSFRIMQAILKKCETRTPKKSILFFVGNVEAAAMGTRIAGDGIDFNRIWNRADGHPVAEAVLNYVEQQKVFVSLDIHNNSGANPFYGCVNQVNLQSLFLAKKFSKYTMFFLQPDSVLSMAMQNYCPSLTLESGLSENPLGIKKILELYEYVDAIDTIPSIDANLDEEFLYQTIARMEVSPTAKILELNAGGDLFLLDSIEGLNFSEVQVGEAIAEQLGPDLKIRVFDEGGNDSTATYLELKSGKIRFARNVVPSMLSRNIEIVKQDCLGYLMQKISVAQILGTKR